ncbi:MAG: DnaD domain protein [Bacillota bacterium]|jgi:DNA replication protein DnaD|nr:DnaD domain protein [Bacillota bacterium]HHT90508.1 DnaD domain protein [Bacillota bacterium]
MTEPTMDDVFALYQQKVALLSSAQKEKLYAAYDEGMTPFVIGCAILRASQERRRSRFQGKEKRISFNYVHRIIQDWLNHGVTTDEHFYAYWSAMQDEQGAGRDQDRVQAKEKIRREDYSYKKMEQDKSLFTWLDD